jgi:hypothetical protein
VLAVFAVAARWLVLRATHSTTEDFFITLRYAENLAAGKGFVYNPGEHVLGTTTPLYTLLLALASLLHLDPITVGKSLNILAEGATVWLICLLAERLGHRKAGWVAGLLYALMSAPISISIGGMETALVTCAGMSAIYFYFTKRPLPFAVASALLFLLRIDGLVLSMILAGAWLFQQRRGSMEPGERLGLRAAGLFVAVILPWVLFATLYFGSPIPVSMLAKLAVYARRPGMLPNLGDFKTQFASGMVQVAMLLLFVVGAVTLWRRHGKIRAVLVWMVAYYCAMLVSRVPAFGWYFLPPLPVYYLCAGFALAEIARRIVPRIGERVALAGLVVLALPLTWHLRSISRDVAVAQELEDTTRRPLGEWLAANAKPADTILLEPIGYIGYYSRLRVLDVIGLVSPEVIPCYRQDASEPLACIVDLYRPQWLILRPSERAVLIAKNKEGSGRLRGEYRWVRAFPDPVSGPAFDVYRRDH